MSNANRPIEPQKNQLNNSKAPVQNGTNKPATKTEQPANKARVNEDGSTLGVYMTMDELAELVKAVKDNAKSKTKNFSNNNLSIF